MTISPRGSAACGVIVGERREIAAAHLLVQLGEFAADRSLARSQAGGEVVERGCEARPGLEQHQRHRQAAEFGDAGAPLPFFPRQEAFEEKAVGRQPRDRERGEHRGCSGHRRNAVARSLCFAHQLEARIGHQGRAGVRNQRDGGARGEASDQLRAGFGRVMIVVGYERRGDPIVIEKLAGHPRVLAGNQVGRCQHFERPHGDVTQIADRGGDQVEAACQRWCNDRLALQHVAAAGGTVAACRGRWPLRGGLAHGGTVAVAAPLVMGRRIRHTFHPVNRRQCRMTIVD